ncbi:MAG: RIP metalloprotease RseP [Ruminococcus sp.]|nr:RIP metalloprotease RseP [Ruminococcus sp.]
MFLSILTTIGLIVIGVLLFMLIIFFHEGGHFIAAKKSGVQVNEFSLGMGPKIISFKKGETQYSLRLLPIGGYCAMEGEDEDSDNPRAFNNAKVWKRMIIIIAGAVMNILLGFIMMFTIVIQSPEYNSTTVSGFSEVAFSANSGLQKGDTFVKINDYSIVTAQDMSFAIATIKCKTVDGSSLSIYKEDCSLYLCELYSELYNDKEFGKKTKQLNKIYALLKEGVPKINETKSKSEAKKVYNEYYDKMEIAAGISDYNIPEIIEKKTRQRFITDAEVIRDGKQVELKNLEFYTYLKSKDAEDPSVSIDFYVEPIQKTFGTVLEQTGAQTVSTIRMVWSSIVGLVQGQFSFKDISGPVGAASAITQVASEGLKSSFGDAVNNILYVMMIITVNLGIFNMLPFPALDGGRFLFLLIEAIFHKPIPRKVEKIVNAVGLIILLTFMAIITFKDIWQLTPFGK